MINLYIIAICRFDMVTKREMYIMRLSHWYPGVNFRRYRTEELQYMMRSWYDM